jgi:hypothetical protein
VSAVGEWISRNLWWLVPLVAGVVVLVAVIVTVRLQQEVRTLRDAAGKPVGATIVRSAPGRPMSSLAISLWAVLLLGIAVAAVWTLLHFYGSGSPTDNSRLEVIKTAGTIVVGTGGAVALYLTARRQQSTERTLEHQREVAAVNEHDALEQRVTEQYTAAAEQLGSDKAPVRMAGLYALQRLGEGNPRLRQTIVNLICAYLRMPYRYMVGEPGLESAPDKGRDFQVKLQELEVRLVAQQVLIDKLESYPRTPRPEGAWKNISIDLRRATLVNFDLDSAEVSRARFDEAVFEGKSSFNNVKVELGSFDNATFSEAVTFLGARVKVATFRLTKFKSEEASNFGGSVFNNYTNFLDASFVTRPEMGTAKYIYENMISYRGYDEDKLREMKRESRNLAVRRATPTGWELQLIGDDPSEPATYGYHRVESGADEATSCP